MTKKILGIAFVALSLVSTNGIAQNNTANKNQKITKAVNKGEKIEKKSLPNPFEGLQLSEAQQTKIQQLNEKQRADRQKMKEERKEQRKAEISKNAASHRDSKKAYLEEVKSILTPEQYVSFLENSYLQKGAFKKGPAKKGSADKGHKKMHGMIEHKNNKVNFERKAQCDESTIAYKSQTK